MNSKKNHIQFFSKIKILFMVPLFVYLFSSTSYAGLVGVKKIIITSSSLNTSQWLQVSEVVAIESSSGKDIALKTKSAIAASTSSYSKQAHAGNAISGVAPNRYPKIYHSGGKDKSPTLEITLASASQLDSITIYGRADCCFKRDFYDLTLINSENKIIFQKGDLDASNKAHSVRVNLINNSSKNKGKAEASTNSKVENTLILSEEATKSQPVLMAKTRKTTSKPANSRPQNYYRDMYNQAVKQKEAKKYKSALKLLNQIIAENNDDYWVAAAKNQKENMYVVTSKAINQTKSEDLQIKKTDNSKPDSYYKKLYGRARQLEKGKRFDEAFEVLDQIINDNSSVKWVKYAKGQKKNVEISKVKHDQYLERRRLSDIKFQKERKEINKKKNAEFIAQWEKNIESMEEGRKHNEKIATQKKAAAKERARQIIKNNNERYPLSDLKFSEDSVINFYKLKIGKTKKSDAINIYGTMLKKEFAKEISEDDIVFTLRKALNGPRTIQKTLFVEQSSLQIHDNITFQCYKYFGKSQSKIVNDCLYFYKDILVGGLFDVGQNNCGTNCDLALQTVKYLSSFFPEKIHSSSNKGTHRLGRTNDNFLFNSLIWGYHTKTTKTTTKTFLAPVGTSNYSNNTKNSAEICIFPKEFLKVLSGYGEKGLYTCN